MNKENVWVTQVHGSMEGKKILEKVSSVKKDSQKGASKKRKEIQATTAN